MAAATHTPGPWTVDRQDPGELWIAGAGRTHPVCMVTGAGFVTERDEADAGLIAAAPTMLEALKRIRLWLAEEGCEEPLELADSALRAAGVTDVTCPLCQGDGEWDEGPLPARSSAQIEPEYRQVKCPDCGATGRVPLTAKESA